MPATNRFFRLRIADDAGDWIGSLTWTSVPSGTQPHIAGPPNGSGHGIDILTGQIDYGGYTIAIADTPSAGSTVTAQLADVLGQYDKLGRLADISVSTDGSSWTVKLAGYVEGIRYPTAALAEISIGDALRIDKRLDIFTSILKPDGTHSAFDKATSIVGGPIRGGWVGGFDNGPWRMKVGAASGTTVRLDFVYGHVPTLTPTSFSTGYVYRTGTVDAATTALIDEQALPYRRSRAAGWYYPTLEARLELVASPFTVIATFPIVVDLVNQVPVAFTLNGRIHVEWPASLGSLPSVGTAYDVTVTPKEISPENPLHYEGHPLDIHTALWDEAGIPWDATSKAAVKAIIGPDEYFVGRATQSYKLSTFQEEVLQGPHRYAWRQGTDGEREFFAFRRETTVPSATIAHTDQLGNAENQPVLFDLRENSQAASVTVTQRFFGPWTLAAVDQERPRDTAVERKETVTVKHDVVEHGADLSFDLPGFVTTSFAAAAQVFAGPLLGFPAGIDLFTRVLASTILSRFGYGCPDGELWVTEAITAQPGQEVVLTIPHQINGNVRGGSRIVQVTKRTERFDAGGALLALLDAGVTGQIGTVPTFTVAANATSPKSFADIVLTNVAALNAANANALFEWGTGGSAPATGTELMLLDPTVTTSFVTPRVNAGTTVWVRARSDSKHAEGRPSGWSAWSSVNLTDLVAPSALARTGNVLAWTNGESAFPVEVLWRPTAESVDTRVAILPAGSVQFDLTPYVPGSLAITATVRHRDELPYAGVSTSATLAYTTAAGAAVTAPTAPSAWVGPQYSDTVDGSFGIAVTAVTLPSLTEMEIAVETGVGAGTYGSYALAATVESVTDGRTRLEQHAPQDRLRRKMRARHRVGTAVSGYTAEVGPVDPWGTFVAAKNFRPQGTFVTAAGVDDGYAAKAQNPEGSELPPTTVQDDGVVVRSLVKGHHGVEARHGDAIVFPNNFQNVPVVLFRGGILHEPRAKWGATGSGSETSAYTTTLPTYEDFAALNLDVSGFTVRARLKQKGTPTARSHNFAGNDLDTEGETVALTLSNAPAVDDKYTLHYAVTLTVLASNEFGDGATLQVTVAVDTNDGAGWVERATTLYSVFDAKGGSNTSQTWAHEMAQVTVSGLDSTDQIRLRCKTITLIGLDATIVSILVHAFDGTGDPASGVTYSTESGSQFANKTPDTEDRVRIDAVAAI